MTYVHWQWSQKVSCGRGGGMSLNHIAGGGVVSGSGVILEVVSNSIRENLGGAKGVIGGESRCMNGGATWHLDDQRMAEICRLMVIKMQERRMAIYRRSHSTRACFIHNACWHVLPTDTYSASVVEMASAFCFLENQDVRQHPMKSMRACFIHNACWHALLADTYFASVVEMASAVCFLENENVRQHPMKVQAPLVLLRST
nr:hypothetical protein [Tanacetum cinerariifolium]